MVPEPQERAPADQRARDARGAPAADRRLRRAGQLDAPAPVARLRDAVRVVSFGLDGGIGRRFKGRGRSSDADFRVRSSEPLYIAEVTSRK